MGSSLGIITNKTNCENINKVLTWKLLMVTGVFIEKNRSNDREGSYHTVIIFKK